jgi:hypothetical protein
MDMKHDELNAAFMDAAKELPWGWTIQLCVEQGAGWVELITPYGNSMPVDTDELTLTEMVNKAHRVAKEAAAELEKDPQMDAL